MFKQLELDFASTLASALWMNRSKQMSSNSGMGCCLNCKLSLNMNGSRSLARWPLGLAEVFCQRAELLIQDWEDRHNTQGPVMDEDFLAGMVQETMFLDISDLCRQPKSRKRQQGFTGKPVESVVGEISKDAVLEFVDELESGEAVALKASHEEDVSAWMGAITEYLEMAEGAVSFAELVKGLGKPVVVVWLGVLLGGFRVEQTGDFYGRSIWLKVPA